MLWLYWKKSLNGRGKVDMNLEKLGILQCLWLLLIIVYTIFFFLLLLLFVGLALVLANALLLLPA